MDYTHFTMYGDFFTLCGIDERYYSVHSTESRDQTTCPDCLAKFTG